MEKDVKRCITESLAVEQKLTHYTSTIYFNKIRKRGLFSVLNLQALKVCPWAEGLTSYWFCIQNRETESCVP